MPNYQIKNSAARAEPHRMSCRLPWIRGRYVTSARELEWWLYGGLIVW